MKSLSIPSYFVAAITKNTVKTGLSAEDLLRERQIPAGILGSRHARLPAASFARLQQDVTSRLQDEMLGYYERPMPPGTFDIACHSLIHSSTVGNAMQRYCRFYQLVGRGFLPEFRSDRQTVSITLTEADPDFDYELYAYESSLYYIHRLMNWLGNAHFQPTRINFRFAVPGHAGVYRPLFYSAPVFFEQERSGIVFSAAALKAPIQQNQQTLARFLKRAIHEMLVQDYEAAQWSNKVIKLINTDLTNIPELDDVASELKLHSQTLRRRLQQENTSFQELKNESRRDYAIYKLSKTEDSIETIALKTGFSEPSTFIRAFKGWTGMTPLSYRKVE